MAGLAAAWEIHQDGRAQALVLEASGAFGGKLRTERAQGLILEEGPDSFLVRKPAAIQLAQELGMQSELVGLAPSGQGSAIYARRRLHAIPAGLMLGLPTEVLPFLRSGLLSPVGKLRALFDLVQPRDLEPGDRPLGPFVARRVGREVVERLVEPLLSGIYAGDVQAMSTQATFPQLLELERKHRSLLLGARRQRRGAPPREAEPAPMFMTLRDGLGRFPAALCAALPEGWLRANSAVSGLRSTGDGYVLRLADGEEIAAESVILALPAGPAAALLQDLAPKTALALFAVPYASVAVAALAFSPEDIPVALRGSGFLALRSAGLSVTACTYVVNKWPHESEGAVLLRCYVGRANEDPLGRTDEEILAGVRQDLAKVLGITATPRLQRLFRWAEAMPQYTVGHPERVAKARAGLAAHPAVQLCGAAYEGVGVPDVVRQGRAAAQAALAALGVQGEEKRSSQD